MKQLFFKFFTTVKHIKNILFSKPYGVGDELPNDKKLSHLDVHDVYIIKQIIKLINLLSNKELIKKIK